MTCLSCGGLSWRAIKSQDVKKLGYMVTWKSKSHNESLKKKITRIK